MFGDRYDLNIFDMTGPQLFPWSQIVEQLSVETGELIGYTEIGLGLGIYVVWLVVVFLHISRHEISSSSERWIVYSFMGRSNF
jgi:hypothetical protein